MTWPLGPLSGSTADTDSSVVPGWAPSRIFSVKLAAPKGRKRGALSFTSNTFMVSLAAKKVGFHKDEAVKIREDKPQARTQREQTDRWGR